ncbi:MAG: UDP-N-acetylmuramoyl-L-alanine--D-glutamate ligase [Cycloclasticus sp.]|nr:UDP-N-acetylmuramoyl-L-alanine--D-glutamate ligase [Cycloclasticus sp.]MBQ0790529.1 UDP-N-acetylmuramoyl-L-alanine--D-glutamate ligase [Cycloclasticus sp.]
MHKQPINQGRGLSQLGLDRIGVRVLVVGLGVTGVSVVGFLQQYNIGTAVVDSRDKPPGLELIETSYPDVGVFIGGFNAAAFDAATHLIVSPGVSLQETEIQRAVERGIPVLGDIDLFAVCADAPIACITGSNGKSTVTTLLGEMALNADWDVRVGGNLGTPALDLFTERAADLYVLELSSFQLERTSQLKADVVTVLNISDDHMDRYPDITSYTLAKEQIFCGNGIAVVNRQDERVSAMSLPQGRQSISFGLDKPAAQSYGLINHHDQTYLARGSDRIMAISALKIKGTHNVQNALAAIAMADALSIPRAAQITALETFVGLPHRTQWVASIGGVTWVNDSKATNPGACLAAIEGLPAPIILIAGGDGKGADFSVLKTAINERVKRLILIGKDAKRFAHEVAGSSLIDSVDTIELAVSVAANDAQPGDTVLLSPACASLDQFENYQQRGERFIAAVRGLKS